ncbi:hypothetical protein BsWGS_24126 [Bradybaena similaris]
MFRRAQDGHEALNLDDIDNWELASEEQDSYSTLDSNNSSNYNSEYNLVLKNHDDQPLIFPNDYHLSAAASLSSSDTASAAVVFSSLDSNSSLESLPVIQRDKIQETMSAVGRQDTLLTLSPKETVADQLTPEKLQKKIEKQQRKKEAARQYRQKKKEDENQLSKTNENLRAKQDKLKREVARFHCVNHKLQEFLSNHECVIPPQQDNGDRMCVETGRNKVWGNDYDSSVEDSGCISLVLELMSICDTPIQYSQGSKSQRVQAIMCELQDGQQSATATLGASCAPERDFNAIVAYNTSIQESSPNSLCNLANPGESKTATGAFSIQETSLEDFYNVANSGELQTGGAGAFGFQEASLEDFYNVANSGELQTGGAGAFGFQETSIEDFYNVANSGELQTGGAGVFGFQETSLEDFYNVANSGELQTGGAGAFGFQETSPDSLYNGANPEGSKTGAIPYGGKFSEKVGPTTEKFYPNYMGAYQFMPYGMPLVTDALAQTSNSSVPLMKPCRSNTINAWATGEDNHSEVEEARSAVQDFFPPPEKKFRRE